MIKREYFFLLILITMLLGHFSCTHKSAGGALSLSDAENKISADADAVLQLWKFRWAVSDSSDRSLNTASEMTAAPSGDKSLPLSEGDKEMIHDGGNTNRSFSPDTATASSYNKFAYDFLAASYRKAEEPNMIVSPLSLEMLLSVLANGANRGALEEILSYLHAPSIEVLNEVNRYWLRLCKNPGEETNFSLANSIWVADDIELKNRFREDMQKDYAATVHSLASDPLQSQKEINLWAKENTNGMITEFLKEPLKRTVKLALYNASYFEGMWRCQFWIQKGYLSPFKTPSGELKLEMMHNNYSDNYYESSKYKGIDIDYYGKIFCMRVIVPNDDCTLDEVMNSLAKGIVKPEKRAILLSMPKFKIRHRIENLEGLLKASGLGIIFNDPACFSSITSHSGLLKEAKLSQEAVIECDENGTKVAAVTGFAMAWDSGKRIEYTKLVIDRPFIFSIVEKKSGAVMFAGIVSDPTK